MEKIKQITSKAESDFILRQNAKTWMLIYKNGSESSECALKELKEAATETENISLLLVDVTATKDIHPAYAIESVPSLLLFQGQHLLNVYKGCSGKEYFSNLMRENLATFTKKEDKTQPKVIVYSTPSCSWCNTLKTHLRMNGVKFTDVDVSRDEQAARMMVQKSGQQGVPQTDINGEIIVGFDKNRINKLLNIQ